MKWRIFHGGTERTHRNNRGGLNMDKRTEEVLQKELEESIKKLCELKLLECIAIGHSIEDLTGESGRWCTEETYRRL